LFAAFVKVLEFNEPNSIVAIPEFNKFLVHCESELSSYPLDKVVRVSQGTAEYKDLGDSAENPAKDDGEVLFLKAGSILDRTGDEPVNRTVGE
jgi:RHO1 GDP-GTP exchange protein 1/2